MSASRTVNTESLSHTYGGKAVSMIEGNEKIGDENYPSFKFDEDDKTLQSLRAEFNGTGMVLRLLHPGLSGTTDVKANRVTAHVAKDDAGVWRIGTEFKIG